MTAIVYMATNLINGKRYIGATSKLLAKRIKGHRTAANLGYNMRISRAIKKYGIDMIRFRVLATFNTPEEAFKAEQKLIAALNPEYNAYRGGTWVRRKPTAEEARRKMSEAARQRTDRAWDRFRKLGPMKSAKKVYCVDDGLEFESASAAARYYDAPKSAVIELCLGKPYRHTVAGRVFKYVCS